MNYQELLRSPLVPSKLVTLIDKASHNNAPVLIQGEEGTGKELVAKLIHHTADWKAHPFYKIDCKFLTEEGFGAQLSRILREINYGSISGTIFLKDVDFLAKTNQLKLLELLNDGVFDNGSEKKSVQHLRFIASASENIRQRVSERQFSQDLYHPLNTLSISLPPLRDRPGEISSIAQFMLEQHSKRMKITRVKISEEALRVLKSYWWPGNLKEFEHVIIRSAILSDGQALTEQDLHFEIEDEKDSFLSFLRKVEAQAPPDTRRRLPPDEPAVAPTPLFFMELVHRIKNPLVSIKTFTQLLGNKFDDSEFRDYFYRIVSQDIEKIDSILDGLLNYIKINSPVTKSNTVNTLLEEMLKKYGNHLEEKKIKVIKNLDKDLPETTLHDEQLRYILDSLVRYALPSLPPYGSMGFLTKSVEPVGGPGASKSPPKGNGSGRAIQLIMAFTGYKPLEPLEKVLGVPAQHREEVVELELRLIREMLHQNRGTMVLEVNEKKPRTLISLKFPVERRRILHYPPTSP